MTIDVPRRIGAVTREIFTREHEGKPARVLVASRDYDTKEKMAWMGSPEGKAFMRQSSEEWRKASIAAGTDVAEAAAAAARTTAAYTGEAEPSAGA